MQDYLLEDVERIEVIRGPGASLWGSNAVNGVINITSKHARNTQGALVSGTVGTEDGQRRRAYGGKIGETGFFRVFGQYSSGTRRSARGWQRRRLAQRHAGFRADWDASGGDALTVQGDVYRADIGQLGPAFNVIGRPGPTGNLEVRPRAATCSRAGAASSGPARTCSCAPTTTARTATIPAFVDDLDTFDVDLQHRYVACAARDRVGPELPLHRQQQSRQRAWARSIRKTRATSCSAASRRTSSASRSRCASRSARSWSTTTSAASRCSPAYGSPGMSRPATAPGRPVSRAPCACRRGSSATSPST